MGTMSLARVLQGIQGEALGRWDGVEVSGITCDSRRVERGDLFTALPGSRDHGAAHLQEACARGAAALLLPMATPPPPGMPGLAVQAPRVALSAAAAACFGHPSRCLRVLGVTGSNGKTTVACMIAQILERADHPTGYWTTNEVWSGPRRFRPALTTPEAPDLHRFLREVRDAGMGHVAMEVSSHGVVQHRVGDVVFRAGVVTTVTPDHLDFHGTYAAYLEAKRGFMRLLPPGALCVHNADDPGACRTAEAAGEVRHVAVGVGPAADLRIEAPGVSAHGAWCTVRVRRGGRLRHAAELPEMFPLRVPIAGRHNLSNALEALCVALDLGVPLRTALDALAAFSPPSRRLGVRRVAGRTIIDDVAMNEASYDAVLATAAELAPQGLVAVVALRGNRGPEINAAIAETLARWNARLKLAPLIASLSQDAVSRYGLDYRVRPAEVGAFLDAARRGGLAVDVHDRLEDAITAAVARVPSEGTLLLLGTFGMDDGGALAGRLLGAGEAGEPFPAPSFG